MATIGASSAKRASDGGCETVSKVRSEGEELKEQVSELCEESEKHSSEQVEFDSISRRCSNGMLGSTQENVNIP